LLCRQPVRPAPLYIDGEAAHRFLRDSAPLASGKGSFRLVDGKENLRAGPLKFLPQGRGFLHRILFAAKPPASISLADKCLVGVLSGQTMMVGAARRERGSDSGEAEGKTNNQQTEKNEKGDISKRVRNRTFLKSYGNLWRKGLTQGAISCR
jgi:hypothetical protein